MENLLEIKNEIKNDINLEKNQNIFLNSLLGKAINTGINIGLRSILPDFIEEQIIDVKDNLLEFGLKDGISKTIQDAVNTGKSAIGIFTGEFENVSQMQTAIRKGGIVESISRLIDTALNSAVKYGKIQSNTANIIRNGKETILSGIEDNIERNIEKQINGVNDLAMNIKSWKQYYGNKDFENMEKEFKKIQKDISNLVPFEETLKEARIVENLHTLIKTNGHNFELSDTERELLKKLA